MAASKRERLRKQILEAIRDLANKNGGKPPGRLALTTATGIKESAWRGVLWARWNDAVKEAGFTAPDIKIRPILVTGEKPPTDIRKLAKANGVKVVTLKVNLGLRHSRLSRQQAAQSSNFEA